MMKYSSILFLLLLMQLGFAQDTRTYLQDKGLVPRERSVDFKHLKLEVSFKPEQKLVLGYVEEDFEVLQQSIDSLYLDGIRMKYIEVKLDGMPVKYKLGQRGITLLFPDPLEWGESHKLSIKYEANPNKGLYFIGWDDESGRSRKQIWTQGQGIDNRHWIPMYDERNDQMTTEMIVHFDEGYQVLSNGEKLKEKSSKDGKKVWHYKMSKPHAPYLIMLGIGNYAIESIKSSSKVPMHFYYYPDRQDQLEPTYRLSKEMFDFFEKEIGLPYPWESYSQIPVQDFMYGAMENTTATIFGDFYLVDESAYLDRNYIRVNAHELAHQWFGDMVTARSAAHHWLQESFATHYDLMYQKEAFGEDFFNWNRRTYTVQALEESHKNLKGVGHSEAGTVRHYPKGAYVLEMLKYIVGKDQFNAAIKYYLKKHAYANVDSDDLLVAFHERLGLSLNWFWEQWIYKGGEPHYEIELKEYSEETVFEVKQVHQRNDLLGLFKMPIWFEVYYADGSMDRKQHWIEEESQYISFKNEANKKVDYVLFDPNSQIMKQIDFPKSSSMLMSQAINAKHMIDRYDAIAALCLLEFENKTEFLMERFEAEEFFAIKGEIIKTILPRMDGYSENLIVKGLQSKDAEVRKTVLDQTIRISNTLEPQYRKLLNDDSYAIREKALDLLAFFQPQYLSTYLELTQEMIGNSSHNIRIKWLKHAYRLEGKQEYFEQIVDYTSKSFEFLTRINACNALEDLEEINEDAIGNLFDGLLSFNNRLRGPVAETIDFFYAKEKYKKDIMNYVANQNWSDKQFKRVSKYLLY